MFNPAKLLTTSAAVGLLVAAACSTEPTGPVSRLNSTPRFSVSAPGYIIDTGPGGTSGGSSLFAKGSTNCSPQPACAGNFQFLAGKITLGSESNVQSLEAWLSLAFGGTINVHIRTDSTPPVGNHIPGHSLHTANYSAAPQTAGWKVFSNFTVTLQPGTYWVTLEPDSGTNLNGGMPGPAASPLSDYAFFADGNNRWVPFSAFSQNPGLAFRVYGTTVTNPADEIASLQGYVSGAGLTRPVVSKINGSLDKAIAALGANNTTLACNYLQDVIDYVNKQGARKIPSSVAAEIISRDNAIRTDVGC